MHNEIIRCMILAGLLVASTGNAATYFVRNGGDDSADGRSHDTAWASLGKIKAFDFQPGDAVLFQEGGAWEGQLIVDWPGTATQRTVIGAYRLVNGIPERGVKAIRPVIDGTDTIPNQYDGLIRVTVDRVLIENIEVTNSEGRGIQFEDAADGQVVGCVVSNSYKSGIKFLRSNAGVISDNVVSDAGRAYPEDGEVWGGAIELVASNGGRISGNDVIEVYGEGINANDGSTGTVIENNRVFAARAVGIYLDAAPDTIVRRNLVAGTTNPDFWRSDSVSGAGIVLNNENYHYEAFGGSLTPDVQSQGARIYDNLVAYSSSGVAFWGQATQSSFDDVLVFNNTLVDNDIQVRVQDSPKPGARIVNNILLSLSPGTRDTDATDLRGMYAKNNYLSEGDPGGDWSHPGNRYQGATLARMTGWRSIWSLEQVSWQDFSLQPASTTNGSGDLEPAQMSQGDNRSDLDFNSEPHNEPMDLGALRFTQTPFVVPRKPTKVRGSP